MVKCKHKLPKLESKHTERVLERESGIKIDVSIINAFQSYTGKHSMTK